MLTILNGPRPPSAVISARLKGVTLYKPVTNRLQNTSQTLQVRPFDGSEGHHGPGKQSLATLDARHRMVQPLWQQVELKHVSLPLDRLLCTTSDTASQQFSKPICDRPSSRREMEQRQLTAAAGGSQTTTHTSRVAERYVQKSGRQ